MAEGFSSMGVLYGGLCDKQIVIFDIKKCNKFFTCIFLQFFVFKSLDLDPPLEKMLDPDFIKSMRIRNPGFFHNHFHILM
jgi:hypothetical protein